MEKNILLITHFLPPSHTAGTEQYTLALGKTLQARGNKVTILCAVDWDHGENYWNGVTSEILDDIPVLRVHLNWLKSKKPNLILYDSKPVEKWLDGFLAANRFDVVDVTSLYSLGTGVLRSIKRANIPLVLTLTDYWFLCPSLQLLRSDGELCDGRTTSVECETCLMANSNIYQAVKRIPFDEPAKEQLWDKISHINLITRHRGLRGMLLNVSHRKMVMKETFALPDVVISPSKIVQTIFMKNMDRQVEYLPHHHELSWLKDYHETKRTDVVRIGYLGQIQKIKGVHLLVDAFVKAGIDTQAKLDIWGNYSSDPQYESELRELMGNNPSISLRGKYAREQLGAIMSDLDVVVVPSVWYENAPLVIQEAFATKTPVIATNLGGMSEAVTHDVNGLLFERNDSDDLARQLIRIVGDRGLLERLKDGIPLVRGFQDDTLEIETIYARVIAERKGIAV